jgi:Arc/MetJ-type ribon-helix-helix transcriptional regulator
VTKQITVRLPNEQVDFLDSEVTSGRAASRADAIARALRREQRRRRAERDLHVILADGEDPELAALADWTSRRDYPALD